MANRTRSIRATEEHIHRYSFTQISVYLNCARKYKFNYVDRIPKIGVNIGMTLGKSLHGYMEEVLTARLCSADFTSKVRKEVLHECNDQMRTIIQDQIREYHVMLEEQNQCLINLQADVDLDQASDQFLALGEQWDKDILPELKPLAVEQKIEMDIGGAPFIMYIDLINQSERGKQIIDWKVTTKAKGEAAAKNSLQLSIYAMATDSPNVAFGSLIRPAEGKERNWKPRVELHHATRNSHDYKWAEEIVASAVEGIQAGVFPLCSTENFLCTEKFCDFWTICRGAESETQVDKPSWFND